MDIHSVIRMQTLTLIDFNYISKVNFYVTNVCILFFNLNTIVFRENFSFNL